jgi:hypothetical protein
LRNPFRTQFDEQGDVTSARAISGHPLLKDPAIAAALRWKFAPTQLGGQPVKVVGTLTFNFDLDSQPPPAVEADPTVDSITAAKRTLKANPYSAEAYLKLAEAYAD